MWRPYGAAPLEKEQCKRLPVGRQIRNLESGLGNVMSCHVMITLAIGKTVPELDRS
jgi:hypothetical protein